MAPDVLPGAGGRRLAGVREVPASETREAEGAGGVEMKILQQEIHQF